MEKVTINNDISKTLFITVGVKAMENEEKNPILEDKFSKEMVKKIDFDFSKYKDVKFSRIGTNQRAKYFDEVTKEFIKTNNNPIVVFVGCGLDTRYLRINGENLHAKFYELDLPEVIEFRKKLLKCGENCTYIKSSMFETSWMDELVKNNQNGQFLFLIEGVLMYFEKQTVKEFITNLASRFKGEIALDTISVWLSENSVKHDTIKNENAKFKYGIDDDKELESWHENIKLLDTESIMGQGVSRFDFHVLIYKFFSLIPKFKKASRLVRYKIY